MDGSADLARFFRALGDDTRLRLVVLLAQQEPGTAMCVSRLARELQTSVPNISQHLRVLKDLDLIYGERRRYRIHYFLNDERFKACFAVMQQLLHGRFLNEDAIYRRLAE